MKHNKIFLSMPIAGNAYVIVTNNASEAIGINILSRSLQNHGYSTFCSSNAIFEDIIKQIDQYLPNFVGLSVTWINKDVCIEISKYVKAKYPTTKVIWGGPDVSFNSEKLLEQIDAIDVIVVGEGQDTIVELIETENWNDDLCKIDGIVYKENKAVISTKRRIGLTDLDQLPLSDRSELKRNIREYGVNTARILTSWGCPNACTFCVNDQWTKLCRPNHIKKRLTRDVKSVCEEILSLYQLGIRNIIFVDEDAIGVTNTDYNRVSYLIEALNKLNLVGIKYSIFTTTKSVYKYPDLYRNFAKIGLNKIFVGVENVSQTGLKVLGGHTKNTINALDFLYDSLKGMNICPTAGFILLTPFSTIEEVLENISFLRENKSVDISAFAGFLFRKAELYPGTKLYDKYVSMGFDCSTPLDYKFIDSKLQLISEILEKAWNRVFYTLEQELSNMKEKFFFNQLSKDEEIRYLQLKNSISDVNLNFIQELISDESLFNKNIDSLVNSYYSNYSSQFYQNIVYQKTSFKWISQQ
jgi:radical SAM superfamily enzyme YgiQ (UPF0313 family)